MPSPYRPGHRLPLVRVRVGTGQTAHTAEAWLLRWRDETAGRYAEVRYRWRELPWETRREWVPDSRVVTLDGEDYSRVPLTRWQWDAGSRCWVELTDELRVRSIPSDDGYSRPGMSRREARSGPVNRPSTGGSTGDSSDRSSK
jgi:hypothetical protein